MSSKAKPDGGSALARSLQICVVYAVTSIVISMSYKALLSVYKFDAKFAMLSYQLAIALALCAVLKRWFAGVPGLEVPDFSWEVLYKSIPPGVVFTLNMVIGWYGLELVNVPLFLCIRRTTTAFTLIAEWLLLGRVQTLTVQSSVVVIVVGAVIAGWESMHSDPLGLAYTFSNNLCTATSYNLTKRFSDSTRVSGFGILMYNAAVALPLCLVGATLRSEWDYISLFPHVGSASFWASLTFASTLGCLMTYVAFLSTTVNSPLATSVTGNVKDILATFVGAAAFNDFTPTMYSVSGIAVSFVGAAIFSWAKLVEMQAAKPASAVLSQSSTDQRGALGSALAPPATMGGALRDVEAATLGEGNPRTSALTRGDPESLPVVSVVSEDSTVQSRAGRG